MSSGYDSKAASRYWSKRLKSSSPLAAVLTYNAPEALNRAYDKWEIGSFKRALPKSLSGKKGLDIGSGIGRIALTLAILGSEVTAIDISPVMLQHLRRQARKKRVASRVNVLETPSDNLPFADSSYDIVTCFGLLEHLPKQNRRHTMSEAFRVLKRNGRLYVVVNNSDCIFLAGSYEMKKQRADGYYVTLVGLDWLKKICGQHGMTAKVVASNPTYAAAHYLFGSVNARGLRFTKEFAGVCDESVKCDSMLSKQVKIAGELASHFLVKIKSSI